MNDFVPVNEPLLDGNEEKYLIECIRSGWISSEGPFVREFEQKFANRMGRKYGIAVCNGTAAIDAAIDALDIGPGDEVILPAFTIISCVLQIVRNGGKPILVDSDPSTWNMDPAQVEKLISSRTRAIMIVHIFGLPVDVDPILEIANRYGLKVIEDAAEMHGQTYKNKPCGSFGDISTFSFYSNKHITTGEGGMILTDDEHLAEICRSVRNLCFQENRRFVHKRLGWNLRMTNLQAALGLAQLERLDEFVNRKRKMGEYYTEILKDIAGIKIPVPKTDYASNIYWVFGVILDDSLGINAEIVIKQMAEEGIGTRPFFCPMHLQPVLRNLKFQNNGNLSCSEHLYRQGFYLPSGMAITKTQMERSVEKLKLILSRI